jgi:hypothetical protein
MLVNRFKLRRAGLLVGIDIHGPEGFVLDPGRLLTFVHVTTLR